MRRGPARPAASAPPIVPSPARDAEQRPAIHRLERQLLTLGVEQRFDLGERRRGPGGQHQLLGLVERDAGKRRKIERQIGLAGATERTLAAAPDDLQPLALGERPLHGFGDLLLVLRFEGVGHRKVMQRIGGRPLVHRAMCR